MNSETSIFVRAVIALFNAVPYMDEPSAEPFNADELLAQSGVLVTEAAQKALPSIGAYTAFIAETHGYDMQKANAGLFDSFAKVQSLSPGEFFFHQALHYLSVYVQNGGGDRDTQGVDASVVYIPRRELALTEGGEPVRIIVIDALPDKEIVKRAKDMLGSGMALSEKTLDWLMAVVRRFPSFFGLADVRNKEFRVRMIDTLGIMPKTAVDFIRYLVLKKTGSSMIVHSPGFIQTVLQGKELFNGEKALSAFVAQNGVEAIAREFNRHKKFWLAFRHDGPEAAKIINRARRLSVALNRPATIGVLDRVGDSSVSLADIQKELPRVTVFKKVSVANSLLRRAENPSSTLYIIRTGRSFVKASDTNSFMTEKRREILEAVMASIVADLRPTVSGKHICIPEEIDYAFPTSEKKFIGPIPELTSLSLPEAAIVGIHWQNPSWEDGTEERADLDLHYTSDKLHVGWNTDFDAKDRQLVIHSGDLTDAPLPQGAAEVIYISDAVRDDFAAVAVNKYTDNRGAVPFSLFVGQSETDVPDRTYLIRREEMCAHINGLAIEHPEMFVGFIESREDGKTLHFIKTALGDSIVASRDKNMERALKAIRSMLPTRLSLKYVLGLAGASFEPKEDGTWDIDLSLNALAADSFAFLAAK